MTRHHVDQNIPLIQLPLPASTTSPSTSATISSPPSTIGSTRPAKERRKSLSLARSPSTLNPIVLPLVSPHKELNDVALSRAKSHPYPGGIGLDEIKESSFDEPSISYRQVSQNQNHSIQHQYHRSESTIIDPKRKSDEHTPDDFGYDFTNDPNSNLDIDVHLNVRNEDEIDVNEEEMTMLRNEMRINDSDDWERNGDEFEKPDRSELLAMIISGTLVGLLAVTAGLATIFDWVL